MSKLKLIWTFPRYKNDVVIAHIVTLNQFVTSCHFSRQGKRCKDEFTSVRRTWVIKYHEWGKKLKRNKINAIKCIQSFGLVVHFCLIGNIWKQHTFFAKLGFVNHQNFVIMKMPGWLKIVFNIVYLFTIAHIWYIGFLAFKKRGLYTGDLPEQARDLLDWYSSHTLNCICKWKFEFFKSDRSSKNVYPSAYDCCDHWNARSYHFLFTRNGQGHAVKVPRSERREHVLYIKCQLLPPQRPRVAHCRENFLKWH